MMYDYWKRADNLAVCDPPLSKALKAQASD